MQKILEGHKLSKLNILLFPNSIVSSFLSLFSVAHPFISFLIVLIKVSLSCAFLPSSGINVIIIVFMCLGVSIGLAYCFNKRLLAG